MIVAAAALSLAPLALVWHRRRRGGLKDFSWRLWLQVALPLLLLLFLAAVGVARGILQVETDANAAFALLGALATTLGFAAAWQTRRLAGREVLGGILPAWQVAALSVTILPRSTELLPAAFRALVVSPAIYVTCAAFGMSVGYLCRGGFGARKVFCEAMLARRFLLSKASPTLSVVTTISIVGVTLGVWLVLLALGILSGFEHDLQRKIIGSNAHLLAQSAFGRPFAMSEADQKALCEAPGVAACAPFVQGEVAVASNTQYTGAMVFGIEPQQTAQVLDVLRHIGEGSLQPLVDAAAGHAAPGLPSIVVGRQMARALDAKVGDTVRLISPTEQILSPLGPAPKSRAFRVAGIYASNMYEYDARFAYINMAVARDFLGLDAGSFSGLQLQSKTLEGIGTTKRAVQAIGRQLGLQNFSLLDWRQRNQTLFSALQLERVVAFVVLVFIILVASFSIVNTLTMSVIEKRREIAILKTMGATDASILKLFLLIGLVIGGFGIGLGTCGGVASMMLLKHFGFWIPGDVYYIDSLPVDVNAIDIGVVVLAAALIIWDFAVFPSWEGSRLAPVEGLRDG